MNLEVGVYTEADIEKAAGELDEGQRELFLGALKRAAIERRQEVIDEIVPPQSVEAA